MEAQAGAPEKSSWNKPRPPPSHWPPTAAGSGAATQGPRKQPLVSSGSEATAAPQAQIDSARQLGLAWARGWSPLPNAHRFGDQLLGTAIIQNYNVALAGLAQ